MIVSFISFIKKFKVLSSSKELMLETCSFISVRIKN